MQSLSDIFTHIRNAARDAIAATVSLIERIRAASLSRTSFKHQSRWASQRADSIITLNTGHLVVRIPPQQW